MANVMKMEKRRKAQRIAVNEIQCSWMAREMCVRCTLYVHNKEEINF